ncbi:TetR/AcrR family transcriptional regulator [Fodinicola acaciae]|uniref:TetR/AcrR family transcriptional regulator n=1 Tax=Fodinicola acaciae TaxID=2681555 RepID=UPI0013D61652|nr:TetR/AcrR family transcriptional regulator [Fodinicola acaciae]
MPARFGQAERAAITEALRTAGRRLFTTQGLRKTSLDELVKPAGIAKSSFYAFYESKESLYLDLMLREAPQRQEKLRRILDADVCATEKIRRFLRHAVDILENDPLYHRLITHPEELAAVARRLSPAESARMAELSMLPLTDFIKGAQENGQLVDGDPEVLLGAMQAALFLPSHRHQLDPRHYDAIVGQTIDTIAIGLTRTGWRGERT